MFNKKYLKYSLISLGLSIIISSSTNAADIEIESYVSGGLTLNANGDWANTLGHSTLHYDPLNPQTTDWNSTASEDYISFTDDTSTDGFYIILSITDLAYTGTLEQDDLDKSNFKIYAQYDTSGASAATKGYDNNIYNLSILPSSCNSVSTSDFSFHNNFSNSSSNYSLTGSNTGQTIFTSTATCEPSLGHIRFDKTQIIIPANSKVGYYSTTLTFTIIDGTP